MSYLIINDKFIKMIINFLQKINYLWFHVGVNI